MFKLVFYVPVGAAEAVKSAVFAAGAGSLGSYDSVCWETAGTGQFRPLPGALPAIGSVNTLARVPELRIEMVCAERRAAAAIAALLAAHPYEQPAYDLTPIITSPADLSASANDPVHLQATGRRRRYLKPWQRPQRR